MDRNDRKDRSDREELDRGAPRGDNAPQDEDRSADGVIQDTPNPPYTTTGKITAPKFGSAGSGGLENEPGPERD